MIKKQVDSLVQEGITAKYILRVGHPADEILTVSKEENVTMIVMGSSGSLRKTHVIYATYPTRSITIIRN